MRRIIFIVTMIFMSVWILQAQNTYSGPKVAAIIPADGKGAVYNSQWFNFAGATQWQTGNPAAVVVDTNVSGLVEDTDGSTVSGTGNYNEGRYADGANYFIYKLQGVKTNLYRIDLRVGNNFKVGLMTTTGGAFNEVLNSQTIFNDDVHDLMNFMYQTVNPNYYLQINGGTVYLKVVDGSTADGWGGKCGALWFRKIPSYQNGETIKFNVHTDKSNHTVTADFTALGGGIVASGNNGGVTNIYPIEFTVPVSFTGRNVLYSIPVKIYNPTYSPDTYNGEYIVYINNPIVGYITNNRFNKDYIYGWNRGESGSNYNEINALYEDSGSAINGDGERYADGTSYFVYKFTNIAYNITKIKIGSSQNYRILISKDNSTWYELANSTNEWGFNGGNNEINRWEREYYIKDYLGTGNGDVYLKFKDLTEGDGWGGICSYVKLVKIPVYKRGDSIDIGFKIKFDSNISNIEVNFGAIDDNGSVSLATNTGGYYKVNYTLSANNTKSGLYDLPIKINLTTGGYRYYYYKIGINYIKPEIVFNTISYTTNYTRMYFKKLKDWNKCKVYISSNTRVFYTNMVLLTETENNYFDRNYCLDVPYYIGIIGLDDNFINSSDAYYIGIVKINENTEDEFYFYGNNSTIKFNKGSILGNTMIYYNEETENIPSGINGIKYYRVEVFNENNENFKEAYRLKLYYNDDSYDNKKLTIYHYDGSQWKRLITSQDTSGSGGYVIVQTTLSGWFAIAEDTTTDSDIFVGSSGFSPDGDGINDNFRFLIPLDEAENVSVEIYNLQGSLVRLLQPEENIESPGLVLEWDGLADNGNKAPVGVYIYKIKIGNRVKKGIFVLKR